MIFESIGRPYKKKRNYKLPPSLIKYNKEIRIAARKNYREKAIKELTELVNKYKPLLPEDLQHLLVSRWRAKQAVVDVRCCFIVEACERGYYLIHIAEVLRRNHASVGNLRERGYDLLITDYEFRELFKRSKILINEGTIQSDHSEQNQSQPTLLAQFHKRKNYSGIY